MSGYVGGVAVVASKGAVHREPALPYDDDDGAGGLLTTTPVRVVAGAPGHHQTAWPACGSFSIAGDVLVGRTPPSSSSYGGAPHASAAWPPPPPPGPPSYVASSGGHHRAGPTWGGPERGLPHHPQAAAAALGPAVPPPPGLFADPPGCGFVPWGTSSWCPGVCDGPCVGAPGAHHSSFQQPSATTPTTPRFGAAAPAVTPPPSHPYVQWGGSSSSSSSSGEEDDDADWAGPWPYGPRGDTLCGGRRAEADNNAWPPPPPPSTIPPPRHVLPSANPEEDEYDYDAVGFSVAEERQGPVFSGGFARQCHPPAPRAYLETRRGGHAAPPPPPSGDAVVLVDDTGGWHDDDQYGVVPAKQHDHFAWGAPPAGCYLYDAVPRSCGSAPGVPPPPPPPPPRTTTTTSLLPNSSSSSSSSSSSAAGGVGTAHQPAAATPLVSPSSCWGAAPEEEEQPSRAAVAFEVRYINLAKRKSRRARTEAWLRGAGLAAVSSRFEAVTGDEAPDAVVAREWDSRLNARFDATTLPHPRVPLTPGERGCAMSHACLWASRAALADDALPLLILEDDVEVFDRAAFAAAVRDLVAQVERAVAPRDRHVVLYLGADVAEWTAPALNARKEDLKADAETLFRRGPRRPPPPARGTTTPHAAAAAAKDHHHDQDDTVVVDLVQASYLWQTSSYVLWPAAARALVAGLPIAEPVDNYMSRLVLEGQLVALVCLPYLCRQANAYCDGDIHHSRPAVAAPPEARSEDVPLAPIYRGW